MRVFIGFKIEPDSEILSFLKDLNIAGIKPVEPQNLHICLKFLGEIDEKKLQEVFTVLETLKGFGTVHVSLDGFDAFPNKNFIRVLYISVKSPSLIALEKLLSEELHRLGFSKESYVPHLTLARIKRKIDLSAFFSKQYKRELDFQYFSVFESKLSPKGPQYTELKRFSLI
ncbi:MAG: RNA 2',3'-cyclic phosphodiesterase [archaeon]